MTLVKQIQIKQNHSYYKELDHLCFLSKNLYNSTLYVIRQHYFETKEYLDYYKVNNLFTHTNQVDYRALPAKVSKMTQKLVDQNFRSFFSLLKSKNYNQIVKIPKYLHPIKGRQVVHYGKQALSFKKQGFIKLSKTNIVIPCDIDKNLIQFVRIVPKINNIIMIEIGYQFQEKDFANNGNYASIDLGINNLITLVKSNDSKPLIINDRPCKSINQYYNKRKAKLQNKLERINHKKSSKRLKRLTQKRNNKIKDYFHKATTFLVNHLVDNQITTLVIGKSNDWKQDTKMLKKVKQIFIQIPFSQLINMLTYKCRMNGIQVVLQEESYTSKSSFLDNDPIPKYPYKRDVKFSGKRIKRGLYQTSKKRLVNADVNGACNILKKYLLKEVNNSNLVQTILDDLIEVFSMPITIVSL